MIIINENTIDQLLVKCDDKEQYSKRSSLRIHGVEVKEKEFHKKVKKMLFKFKYSVRSK